MNILEYDDIKRLKERAEKSEEDYILVDCFVLLKLLNEIKTLGNEANWLAEQFAERLQDCPYEICKQSNCGKIAADCWREAARKAVAEERRNEN